MSTGYKYSSQAARPLPQESSNISMPGDCPCLDDLLLEAIKERADAKGESLNATIKELLAKAVGLEGKQEDTGRATGYRRFLGLWTAEEAAAFESATTDFERIDASDWNP